MPYIKKTTIAGDTVEVKKYFSGRYGKKGSRKEHYQPTPKDVAENNKTYAEQHLTNILNANFKANDWWVTFTYFKNQKPETTEEVVKQGKKLFENIKKVYKKAGIEFKYVYVDIYRGKAPHYHFVLPDIDIRLINALWECGSVYAEPLYRKCGVNDFKELAIYIIKNTDKQFSRPDSLYKRRYHASKNLKIPKPKRKVIKAKTWLDEPKPPKGYLIAPPGVENYTCKLTGLPCQYYRLIKAENSQTIEKKSRRLKL